MPPFDQGHAAPVAPLGAPVAEPASGEPLKLSWQWPRGMVGVSIANFLLRILTLGIYHFWGKTEVRRRIWSAIRLNGEPLTYTGTGGELFFGFVIVSLAVFLPLTLLMIGVIVAFGSESALAQAIPGLAYIPILFLVGVAIYRATRYRLARTRWRGIRGALAGHSGHYGWTFFWTLIVAGLTLGWAVPWRSTKLQALQVSSMRFGDRPMRFTATSEAIYGPFAVLWLGTMAMIGTFGTVAFILARQSPSTIVKGLAIPQLDSQAMMVLGLIASFFILVYMFLSAWYRARVFNHFADHTHFESASFSGNASAGGLIWIAVTNYLILLVGVVLLALPAVLVVIGIAPSFELLAPSDEIRQAAFAMVPVVALLVFGLGFSLLSPVAQARTTGYLVRHLAVTGTAPLAAIAQASGGDAKFGEGLAQAFDVDAF